MIGIAVMDMPTHTEIELLIHKFAVLETKSPVFEEDTTIFFPRREVISKILHSAELNVPRLSKHRCYKTCKEPRQCTIACLVGTQESLTRLASVCEKPPEQST